MKWVTRALTAWNILAPAVSLGGVLLVELSSSMNWNDVDERLAAALFVLGVAWLLGTPVTAGAALLLNRRVGERVVKWINLGALLFWAVGAPTAVLGLHF